MRQSHYDTHLPIYFDLKQILIDSNETYRDPSQEHESKCTNEWIYKKIMQRGHASIQSRRIHFIIRNDHEAERCNVWYWVLCSCHLLIYTLPLTSRVSLTSVWPYDQPQKNIIKHRIAVRPSLWGYNHSTRHVQWHIN